jgi:hypothetical protein
MGCGASIHSDEAAGGAGGGETSMTSTPTTSSSSETSEAGGGGSAATGSGGAGVGGGNGGSGPCSGAYLSMTDQHGDPPPVISINDVCPNSWGSNESARVVGYEGYSGPGPGGMHELFIEGCQHDGPAHLTLEVPLFSAGMASTDDGQFQLSGVSYQTAHGIKVTITAFGAEKGSIEGSFAGKMSSGGGGNDIDVSGSFRVCHVADFLPP